MKQVREHKLPTDQEAEVLNEMEDVLVNQLTKVTTPIEVGRETYYGEREILLYFTKISNYKPVVDLITKKLNTYRPTKVEFHHDPIWHQAKRYLGGNQN